jgi:glycosyl transferase family 25
MKVFLINLDRSADRLTEMRAEFGRLGINFTRFPGTDTLGLPKEELEEFFRLRPSFEPHRRLPGDAGNFISHFRLWGEIAAGDDSVAAVFEDDVHVAADMPALLSSEDWLPADADVVRLEANSRMVLRDGRRLASLPKRKIYRAVSGTWGTAGYVIRREAAARLAQIPAHLHTHIDWFMFKPTRSPVAASLSRYQIVPALCIQDQLLFGDRAKMRSIVSDGIRVVRPQKQGLLSRFIPRRKQVVPFAP